MKKNSRVKMKVYIVEMPCVESEMSEADVKATLVQNAVNSQSRSYVA